jgi:hypothetical protein
MLSSLPPEVVEHVAALLSPQDLCSLVLVSASFYNTFSQPRFWTHANIRYIRLEFQNNKIGFGDDLSRRKVPPYQTENPA